MEIRFVSSLNAEDENYFAPALLKAISALLDQLPIAYTMRIETTGAQVFQHSHAGMEGGDRATILDAVAQAVPAGAPARLNLVSRTP